MRTLVQEMKISITNALRIMISEDLRYKLMLRRCQFMSEEGKRMQEWLKESLPEVWEKEVWPPSSSPNYSLLDYFVWGVSELLFDAKPRNKIKELIQKLKVVMGS
jgi:hypothetical protein